MTIPTVPIGTPLVRAYQLSREGQVLHSWSGTYLSRLRQEISDHHKQNPKLKYWLHAIPLNHWYRYDGKPPYDNAIIRRFTQLAPRYVPKGILAYRLICPED